MEGFSSLGNNMRTPRCQLREKTWEPRENEKSHPMEEQKKTLHTQSWMILLRMKKKWCWHICFKSKNQKTTFELNIKETKSRGRNRQTLINLAIFIWYSRQFRLSLVDNVEKYPGTMPA